MWKGARSSSSTLTVPHNDARVVTGDVKTTVCRIVMTLAVSKKAVIDTTSGEPPQTKTRVEAGNKVALNPTSLGRM